MLTKEIVHLIYIYMLMKKFLFTVVFVPFMLFGQAPQGYYNGTENLSGYRLKTKLHEIISANTVTWHYGDLPGFYTETDVDHFYDYGPENDSVLLDIYSNNPAGTTAYHYTAGNLISSASAEGQGYNREHMMPQSTFNSNYPMYSDLFFVIPADARINQLRSNYPYGLGGSKNFYLFTNSSRISNNATPGSAYTGRVYEPHPEFRGDIARAMLYFAVRYQPKLGTFKFYNGSSPANDTNPLDGTDEKAYEDWFLNLMLQWHQQDPVSPFEIERNNKVYALQNNRNPFIDHPEWVSAIWTQTTSAAPEVPTMLQAEETGAHFVKLTWSASGSAPLGYSIYNNGTFIGKTSDNYYYADRLKPSTSYTFTVKAYNEQYAESAMSTPVTVATEATDVFAKDLQITKYIEGTGENKALEITNRTGHPVNLESYRLSIQMYNDPNYYFPAPYELEGTIQHNESIIILNPKATLSCNNSTDPKFRSAAPQLSFSGHQYLELRYQNQTVDAVGIKNVSNFETLADVSLYRKPQILEPSTSFDLAEWQAYPVDFCDGLGTLSTSGALVQNSRLQVYPNPANEVITLLNYDKTKETYLYDLSGKLLKVASKTTDRIKVKELPAGVYIIKNGSAQRKFIKK